MLGRNLAISKIDDGMVFTIDQDISTKHLDSLYIAQGLYEALPFSNGITLDAHREIPRGRTLDIGAKHDDL